MRIDLTGDPYSFSVATPGSTGTVQVGYALYDHERSLVRTFTFTQGDDDHGVFLEGDDIPTVQGPKGIEVLTGDGAISLTGTMNGEGMQPDEGVHFLVLWLAQKTGGWTWNVGGGMTILGLNEGQESIALSSSDLSGTLVAHARPLHRWGGPSVYIATKMSFSIEHAFIGAAEAPLVHTDSLVVSRPDGSEQTCPCYPRDAVGFDVWGPGAYEARRDGLDVVLTGGTDLHVMGVDVELPLEATMNVGDSSGVEGAEGEGSTLTFTVTKSGTTVKSAQVSYSTADGSATAGSDYEATSGTLTFAPDQITRTITVPVIGDGLAEGAETFSMVLSGAIDAAIGTAGTGVGTIHDDD